MSRYTVDHPTLDITVGWDNPLQTLFCTVLTSTQHTNEDEDDEETMLLCGGTGLPGDTIRTITELANRLSPYAQIPGDIANRLQADMNSANTPTPLQRFVNGIFRDSQETGR